MLYLATINGIEGYVYKYYTIHSPKKTTIHNLFITITLNHLFTILELQNPELYIQSVDHLILRL